MKCPICKHTMGAFEAVFTSVQEGETTIWIGDVACVGCNVYLVMRALPVPDGMDPASYAEGYCMAFNHPPSNIRGKPDAT